MHSDVSKMIVDFVILFSYTNVDAYCRMGNIKVDLKLSEKYSLLKDNVEGLTSSTGFLSLRFPHENKWIKSRNT